MSLGRSRGVALVGIEGHVVDVEADVAPGLPRFVLVGLPDASLNEARDRVRAAFHNAGVALPLQRITVNLFPASLPKGGTGFDLAIAAALLAANGTVHPARAAGAVHLGELGLDGAVRAVAGVLPAAAAARRAGAERLVVPRENAAEARLVPGLEVVEVASVRDLVAAHGGDPERVSAPAPTAALTAVSDPAAAARPVRDLSEVLGQQDARDALEIAAAGGHHLLLQGPPGAGKTMLAARLPGLLPDLTAQESLDVSALQSLAGRFDAGGGLLRRPPYEDPHHTATPAAVLGGGSGVPRPGAASRAHRGVLLLDEAPEFSARVLEGLRQPLEGGELVISRSAGAVRFPARFQLVLTANPCPCGRAGGKGRGCECTPMARRRYRTKLSGPLLDRVDLQLHVHPVRPEDALVPAARRESTAQVATRVAAARAVARDRLAGSGATSNGEAPGALLRGRLRLPAGCTAELDRGLRRGTLTMRGVDRVLRLAWTLADVAGDARPDADHVARAATWRTEDVA